MNFNSSFYINSSGKKKKFLNLLSLLLFGCSVRKQPFFFCFFSFTWDDSFMWLCFDVNLYILL